jgi:hypothetical protein
MEQQPVLQNIDPELAERVLSRRAAILRGASVSAGVAAGLAVASVPVALAAFSREAFGQGASLPQDIIDVLNFALTLEFLESTFYDTGVATSGLIPSSDIAIFQQIMKHEDAHVVFLQTTLGSAAVEKPTFDFTAGNGSNNGPFADVFSNYETFKTVSQAFEDTGVRAFKGQVANLISNDAILTAALQIHSVEARHAAAVRQLRGLTGWISDTIGNLPTAVNDAVYGAGNPEDSFPADDNIVQGGLDLAMVGSGVDVARITAAFDEPLDRETVLAIAAPFIVGDTP